MKRAILLVAVTTTSVMGQQLDLAADSTRVLRGAHLGQSEPGEIGRLFAPRFVSTQYQELNGVEAPGGQAFYFSRRGVPGQEAAILVTHLKGGTWTVPEGVGFDSRYSAIDLFITADGRRMVFCSNRPRHKGEGRRQDHDFWISDRTLHEWGEPRLFAIEALSDAEDYFPIITQSGNFYFNSQREGAGTNNIFRSRFVEGRYLAAEKLPAPINSRYREFDAWVSPDEKMIVFASERPGGKGGSDLYISFLQDNGSWATPRNLGPGVNTRGWEYGPRPSVDGKFLFYTSTQGHNENIYWVSMDVLQTNGGGA